MILPAASFVEASALAGGKSRRRGLFGDGTARRDVMENRQEHAHKWMKLAKTFYDRGLVFIAFLTVLFAFFCSGSEQTEIRALARSIGDSTAALETSGERSEAARQSQWLSRRAESVARLLQAGGIRGAAVYHRVKSQESAAEKARRKHVAVGELNDLYGMRVVVRNELDVYRSLNIICDACEIVPGTLKNYIATPKASGYRSIHVVAQIDENRVEFQLRSQEMHAQSEAEHEAYKSRVRAA